MDRFERILRSVSRAGSKAWEDLGDRIRVSFDDKGRHQDVFVHRADNLYVFTSVVLGSAEVTRRPQRWRQLAVLAWEKNAEHQLVTFAFDKKDRLIGKIEHQVDYLDPEELELYVNTLALKCDRFEYVLSGEDRY